MKKVNYDLIAKNVLKSIDDYLTILDKNDVDLIFNTFKKSRGLMLKGNEQINNHYNNLLKLFGPALSDHDGTKFNVLLKCAETVELTGDSNVGDILLKKIKLFIGDEDNEKSDQSPNCCFF